MERWRQLGLSWWTLVLCVCVGSVLGLGVKDLIDALKAARDKEVADARLKPAQAMHRKAQWRLDYVMAENSLGFHAPSEAARILAEAVDYARQGQIMLLKGE